MIEQLFKAIWLANWVLISDHIFGWFQGNNYEKGELKKNLKNV